MKEVKRLLNDRYICLFVDLQKASTAEDAIVELSLALKSHNKLWGNIKELFANALNKIAGAVEELNIGALGIKLRAGLYIRIASSAGLVEKEIRLFPCARH